MNVVMRSYNAARSGATLNEIILTPRKVASNLLFKKVSLDFAHRPGIDDDPFLEAQPLYVAGLNMEDGHPHDVIYVCTMANNVWAFDANTGRPIWGPTNLGRPIKPGPDPHNPPPANEIDRWGINGQWGILSTPVLDPQAGRMYVVCWTSPDETVANAVHELHAMDIKSGQDLGKVQIAASAAGQALPGKPVPKFISSKQKQRASLLFLKVGAPAKSTVFIGFGMTHEERDPTHGWLLAYDVDDVKNMQQTAAWCTTPGGTGCGIWQAGQGPCADENGDVYVMTGNYGVLDQNGETELPTPADLPESFVKLHYSPPTGGAGGKLEPVAWFTPFRDHDRPSNNGSNDPHLDDFQDYDLGSAGPLFLTGLNLVIGSGKDGVLYVLPQDTAAFGKGSDFSRLKQPPIFFTYFPGFGIDASNLANLNILRDGKTHHQHCSPAFWDGSIGPMLFNWGENECLRAWKIDATGRATFVAKSSEIASAGAGGRGGMPGGILCVSSNGKTPNTGIVWATAPINGDANKFHVPGILRAYDATSLDSVPNLDGTPKLRLLWDSTHIPGNVFTFCKFCPPVVADGNILVPTYDGRVDVYTLHTHQGAKQTNANF